MKNKLSSHRHSVRSVGANLFAIGMLGAMYDLNEKYFFTVIPAQAGIHARRMHSLVLCCGYLEVGICLDSRLRGNDVFRNI